MSRLVERIRFLFVRLARLVRVKRVFGQSSRLDNRGLTTGVIDLEFSALLWINEVC